ncbi:putative zinc protease-like protein y4wB [Pseudomonas reidholzensis]|uniref:Putative zinc protease-like protein y4wB n=1 Tax=Pseudomonas reidholzensis TaxID=1785162 RepID=A0A383S0U4_9PSED|nr:pitrilysin family protein [Pseudomonas reidholzensis]SYX92970.1 putative zinc protease-like protein y4wB [Pseudomonas reidholzensis]
MSRSIAIENLPTGACASAFSAIAEADLARLTSTHGLDLGRFEPIDRNVQHWQTEGGSRVRFAPSHEQPMFDLVLRFSAGATLDGERPGLAALTLYMLDQGTQQRDAAAFAQALEGLGAIMTRTVALEHATITLRGLSAETLRNDALALLMEMLAQPAFDAAALDKLKARLLVAVQSADASLHRRIQTELISQLFADHPYATSLYGTEQAIAEVTPAMLHTFHRRAYSANNLHIGLVGDMSREAAQQIISRLTQALPQGWAAAALPPVAINLPKQSHIDWPGTSNRMALALPIKVSPSDPQHPALLMANEILGSGIDSRLMRELRTRLALTYSVESDLKLLTEGGFMVVSWDVEPAFRDASRERVLQLIRCLIEQGPSAGELQLALNQFAGKLLDSMSDNGQLASGLASHSQQGQPADHLSTYLGKLAELTPDDIRAAARRWLDIDHAVFVSGGPNAAQRPLPEPAVVGH